MAGQFALLVLVLAVATGLVTATVSALLVQSRRIAFFRYFLANILLFNLLLLAGLTYRYVEFQGAVPGPSSGATLLLAVLAVLSVIKVAWLYAFVSMTLVLPGENPPAWFFGRFVQIGACLFSVWAVLLLTGSAPGRSAILNGGLIAMETGVIGAAVAGCAILMVRSRTVPSAPRRKSLRILAWGYLAIFTTIAVSVAIGWVLPEGATSRQALLNSGVMALYNLFSLAWVLRYQPLGPITEAAKLDRYGITTREREIIESICAGHTNQEIAEKLFISLATVKDHNYNIFRKTGVRNRVELANLFRGRET